MGYSRKKGTSITNDLQEILQESNRKQSKIWVDKGSESYNRSIKSWLEKNPNRNAFKTQWRKICCCWKIYKNKIYKYMTSVSKNVYIDKLDDIVNKYIDTYHSTIKLISANVKLSTYIDSSKEIDDQDSKYKIDYTVRISKYKNIFGKDYVPN